jgi:tetratricopeptide (TPR) repeat protein
MRVWLCHLLVTGACLLSPFPALADEFEALLNQAAASASRGEFKAAEKHYRKALQYNSQHPQAQLGLATALKAQGRLNDAQMVLEALIAQEPGFQPAYYLLGMIYEERGEQERAQQAYHTYAAIAPDKVPNHPEVRVRLRRMSAY